MVNPTPGGCREGQAGDPCADLRVLLDHAVRQGFRVLIAFDTDGVTESENVDTFESYHRQTVEEFGGHEALLGYYVIDEPVKGEGGERMHRGVSKSSRECARGVRSIRLPRLRAAKDAAFLHSGRCER